MKNLLFALCLCGSLGVWSQHSTEVSFKTEDQIKISATYELPTLFSGELPVVILIHQGGSSSEEWKSLPLWNELIEAGYAVLAYDVRNHGKSEKDKGGMSDLFNNPRRAPLDLLAAIKFLKKDKRIDEKRIGIIGASIGANLACVAASSEYYPIKAVISLSAKTTAAQNLSGQNQPIKLKNAFVIASEEEQNGMRKKWAKQLYEMTSGNRLVGIAPGNKHGSYILKSDKEMANTVLEWIKIAL